MLNFLASQWPLSVVIKNQGNMIRNINDLKVNEFKF